MKVAFLTRFPRLKEVAGLLLLFAAVGFLLSLASYDPLDPSWNTATGIHPPHNRIGRIGAHLADLNFQALGLAAWILPLVTAWLGYTWLRGRLVRAPAAKALGLGVLAAALCASMALAGWFQPYAGAFPAGGVVGIVISNALADLLNPMGTWLLLAALACVALYMISSFSLGALAESAGIWWSGVLERRAERAAARKKAAPPKRKQTREASTPAPLYEAIPIDGAGEADSMEPAEPEYSSSPADEPPFDVEQEDEIPIRTLDDEPSDRLEVMPREAVAEPPRRKKTAAAKPPAFELPPTTLLNEPNGREAFDTQELKDTAARIKAKLEEFNVMGSVVQINPGPVVTTFEFKPDAGVKIAKITTLSEDLCLGLQAESILIERIPGKPTVGIEVPNSRREQISLRQILEADEFYDASSRLTVALGKDISGRFRIAEMEKMPHLLIAGSTGSGKSVMLNALIMSILFKSTPEEVRMIMVDPKRLELGLYEGIPHLLTPVITEPKKATNALRNAVLEMERRLKLLASYGVRNIDQFNKKIRAIRDKPLTLFDDQGDEDAAGPEQPLPYILIIIDELADLMMQDRAGVEESIIRLAQMARAVGMHLVVATQRPSVDVITGLIKANFPARISFRVATRVDSRTVLDVMGAEHLLGKGDMLFLPPGTSRLLRVHGAFVTESEINEVVEHWKSQGMPEYDQTFLLAPPSGDEEAGEFDGEEDPLYRDAVRVILEMGKASTSILQRRLRLGYGRAARILDQMQHEGIIGPPDGSRPRDVLKRPDWLDEVETSLR
jgi:DNA segregation ATPase FtsK/SpoIIIE, S-DNA-T family